MALVGKELYESEAIQRKLKIAGFTRVVQVSLIPQPEGAKNLVGWWKVRHTLADEL